MNGILPYHNGGACCMCALQGRRRREGVRCLVMRQHVLRTACVTSSRSAFFRAPFSFNLALPSTSSRSSLSHTHTYPADRVPSSRRALSPRRGDGHSTFKWAMTLLAGGICLLLGAAAFYGGKHMVSSHIQRHIKVRLPLMCPVSCVLCVLYLI